MANPNIAVTLSADTSALFSDLNKATAGVKAATDKLSGSFAGVGSTLEALKGPVMALASIFGGGALFGSAISDTINFSKEITKLSNVFGVSKQQATVLQIAIGDIYGDSDTFMAGASKFTKTLQANEDRITQLTGVRTRDNGVLRNGLTVMLEVLQGMDKYKAGIDKNLVAQELFGKSFKDMLKYAQLTTGVMLEAEEKVNKLGLAFGYVSETKIKAYRAAQNDLDDSFLALKKNISVELMPSLTTLGNILANVLVPVTKALVPVINAFMSAISMTTVQIALGVIAIGGMVKALGTLSIITKIIEYYQVYASLAKLEGVAVGVRNVQAFGSAIYTAIGPVGIAIGVITALAVAFEYLANQEKRAADNAKAVTDKHIERAEAMRDFAEKARAKFDIINDPNQSKNKQAAKDVLKSELEAFNLKWKAAFDYNALIKMSYEQQKDWASNLHTAGMGYASSELEARKKELESRKAYIQSLVGTTQVTDSGDDSNTSAITYTQHDIDLMLEADSQIKSLTDSIQSLTKAKSGLFNPDKPDGRNTKYLNSEQLKQQLEDARQSIIKADKRGSAYEMSLDELSKFWNNKIALVKAGSAEEAMVKEALLAIHKKKGDEDEALIQQQYKKEITNAKGNKEEIAKITDRHLMQTEERLGKHNERTRKLEEASGEVSLDFSRDKTHAQLIAEQGAAQLELDTIDNHIKSLNEHINAGIVEAGGYFGNFQELTFQKFDLLIKMKENELIITEREKGLQSSEVAKLKNEIALLKQQKQQEVLKPDYSEPVMGGIGANSQGTGAFDGMKDGLQQFKSQFISTANQLKSTTFNLFSGLQSTLNNTLMGLMNGQIRAGMALQSIWKGLGTTVAGELAKIVSAKIAGWIVDKAISAWDTLNTAQKVGEAGVKTGAKTVEAGAGIWASFSSMGPWGIAAAIAAVAIMIASITSLGGSPSGGGGGSAAALTPYSDRGTGLQFTGRAIGGLVNRPEFTLLGEAGPEVVAPVQGFKEYSLQLMSESINSFGAFMGARQAAIGSYSAMSSQYATVSGNSAAVKPGASLTITGGVFAEGAEKQIYNMLQNYQRMNG